MRPVVRIALLLSLPISADIQAQAFKVGDTVDCNGNLGTIVRTEPRVGWDEPFYIVATGGTASRYELNCLPSHMRKVDAARSSSTNLPTATPSPPAPAAAAPSTPAAPATAEDFCREGARLEGQWGIQWYDVTVLAAPNANGQCKIRFDGYGPEWDSLVGEGQLRPRGSGPVTRPQRPVADTQPESDGATATTVPDGSYRCSKITPGSNQLMSVGTLTVRNGQGTLAGMPDGWTVHAISTRGRNARGELIVALDYRSASGFNDRLDCTVP